MYVDQEMLNQVASDIFSTMLGVPVYELYDDATHDASLLARVQISGEWNATVEVATTTQVATLVASQMFSIDPASIQTDDLHDALGELANMVGGNVKGIVNGELDLSLPTVEVRETPITIAPEATVVRMACPEGPITVILSESQAVTVLSSGLI